MAWHIPAIGRQQHGRAPTVCQGLSGAQAGQDSIQFPHPLSLGAAWGEEETVAGTLWALMLAP